MLMQALKTETRALHEHVERNPRMAQLMTPTLTRKAYQDVLERMLGLHEPLEAHLAAHASDLPEGLNLVARRKTNWLITDLKALGYSDDRVAALPRWGGWLPSSAAEMLGCLYVLEGSTLGGKIISKQIRRTLGISSNSGLRFFTSYGDDLGPMWKAFGNVVNAYGHHAESKAAVIKGASATFEAMDVWLLASKPVPA